MPVCDPTKLAQKISAWPRAADHFRRRAQLPRSHPVGPRGSHPWSTHSETGVALQTRSGSLLSLARRRRGAFSLPCWLGCWVLSSPAHSLSQRISRDARLGRWTRIDSGDRAFPDQAVLVIANLRYRRFGVSAVTKSGCIALATGITGWALAREPWQLFLATLLHGAAG